MKTRIAATIAVLALGACSGDTATVGPDDDAGIDADMGIPTDAANADTEMDVPTDAGSVDDVSRQDGGGLDVGHGTGPDVGTPDEVAFQTELSVDTASGPVRGVEEDGLRVFRGIPFAEPPVDDLRLKPTVPVEPWTEELDASDFGPSCVQQAIPFVTDSISEDCLTLNAWAHTDEEPKPVMVWIYGGGFLTGGSAWDYYDGAQLAENGDVVVISFNYRLGPLGYLATPELKADSPDGSVGNYGMQDQLEALRWIRKNAPAFGGDPNNITIFGESAGGFSVCSLIGTPLADDLFDKAIMQSGGCQSAAPLETSLTALPSAYESGETMVESLGCDGAADPVACLRGLPEEDFVLDASILLGGLLTANISLGPVMDGVVLAELPYQRIADGRAPARPLIAGSNGNEGALFTQNDVIFTRFDLRAKFEEVVDEATADELMNIYDAFSFPLPKAAWDAFVGEVIFGCNSYHSTLAHAAAPSYYYYLSIAPLTFTTPTGPLHGTDIFYTFGTFSAAGIIPSFRDLAVRDLFQSAWSTFARTGAPGLTDPAWPPASVASPEFYEIGIFETVEDAFRGGRCDELRSLGIVP